MKITPHTVFIYSHGNYLRIVRGEHSTPETTIKPRVYPSVAAALENEHRARIVRALQLFPTDRVIDRRMKSIAAPIKVKSHQTLADSIRSSKFKYAQAGFDAEHREVSFIYHSDPRRPRGIVMVRTGLTPTVRKLLKKYRKPPLRELNYQEPPRKKRATAA